LTVPLRIRKAALERGVIVRASAETIVVCPPLIITQAQIDQLVSVLDEALATVAAELSQ
jgi:adenosylmethionine-8-amino-7-oxononanoate aminotransferase